LSFKSKLRKLSVFPLTGPWFLALLRLFRCLGILPKQRNHPSQIESVLLIYLTDHLGDSVMMLPLVDDLHASLPRARIDLVVGAKVKSLMDRISFVERVLSFPVHQKKLPILGPYWRLLRLLRFAREQFTGNQYDICVVPRWGDDPWMSKHLALMTGAPVWGHYGGDDTFRGDSFPGLERAFEVVCRGGYGLPEAIRCKRILAAAGLTPDVDFRVAEREPITCLRQIAASISLGQILKKLELKLSGGYLVIAPGASHPSRRWPPEFIADLIREINTKVSIPVHLVGGPDEMEIGSRIEALAPGLVLSVVGKTSLIETVKLLAHASLFIGNDSGPAHLAAGLGTPTVVLSSCPLSSAKEHPNSPRRVRPVGPSVIVLQPVYPASGCVEMCNSEDAHCIKGVTVEQVYSAAFSLLSCSAQPPRLAE
jgi:ADP-heptose:LPS heptosyltransferase